MEYEGIKGISRTWDELTNQPKIDEEFPAPNDHLRTHQEEIATKKWTPGETKSDSQSDIKKAA